MISAAWLSSIDNNCKRTNERQCLLLMVYRCPLNLELVSRCQTVLAPDPDRARDKDLDQDFNRAKTPSNIK